MNDFELGRLLSRMDNLERTTELRHVENKENIESIKEKLDLLVTKFSEVKGGWFVLTILGSIALALGALLYELIYSRS